eukprot:TRINITY_DN20394_c0_g1_i1.p1 TRINITY_DN20394_c0_g1~~TRINITY_DN20394_c0_g1_i1.p1  ORF type:complete len:383 (+),score=76.39 TRINITY_DN20394_c0_g1_i1:180-1328(+)
MDRNVFFLVVAFVLYALVVHCYGTEVEGNKMDPKLVVDSKNPLLTSKDQNNSAEKSNVQKNSAEKSNVRDVNQEKNRKDLSGGEKTVKNESELESKEIPKVEKVKNESGKVSTADDGKEKRNSSNGGSDSTVKGKEGVEEPESRSSKQSRKEKIHVEECDSAHSCKDEKNKLIACLRVPGNESPELSLLIQNRGMAPLTVKITASESVHLEITTVQLQEKEDKKVKVSIGDAANDTTIILTAREGHCNLDFRDIRTNLPNSGKKSDYSLPSMYSNLITGTSAAYMFLTAVLLIGAIWACVRFWRYLRREGSRYQKVGLELSVSDGGKPDSDTNDGWDNSWGDGWDDEEAAPITPSKPVSKLSSKGLASRRSNKEGWQSSWND